MFHKDLNFGEGISYLQVMKDLNITQFSEAHVDPDLRPSIITDGRNEGWRALFGQSGGAEGTLRKKHISKGDIFLFFGWFREVIRQNDGRFTYKRGAPHQHVIFGYMELGQQPIHLKADTNKVPEWALYHPHVSHNDYYAGKGKNTLYVAGEHLSYDPGIPAAGCFKYDSKLVLTKTGSAKKSMWELPGFFDESKFLIGKELERQTNGRWNAKISGRGQEVYIDDNPEMFAWAVNLIRSCKRFE